MNTTYYCKECGRVLSQAVGPDGAKWIHHLSEAVLDVDNVGHEAVPVTDAKDAQTHCDFCNDPQPRWVFPQAHMTETRMILIGNGESRTVDFQDEEWAACDGCKPHVEQATDPAELSEWVFSEMIRKGNAPPLDEDTLASVSRHMVPMYKNLLKSKLTPVLIKDYEDE